MEELETLIASAQCGDLDAFGEIVHRFEASARTRALAILGDADLADDAVQEAFVGAYRDLSKLRDPAAFPGWFMTIVSNHSKRLIRGKRVPTVPLDEAVDVALDDIGPAEAAERRELKYQVLAAIRELPEHERVVTGLFYLDGLSQNDIATTLGVPMTTVNSRLHAARKRLRTRIADLAPISYVERMSRSKEKRHWLPSNLSHKEAEMALEHTPTNRKLLRGDAEVLIRVMTSEDIPAMRRFDDELGTTLQEHNLLVPPGRENNPGGPWSDDEWLAQHFDMYRKSGNVTLLAEDGSGRIVGFADLWAAHEPEPFGDSLDVECIDYFVDYYGMGLELILLEEAEKVARAAGLPALDIGTNTSSGDYPCLRRFGLKVIYEYDEVHCRCRPLPPGWQPSHRILKLEDVDTAGLLRVSHWSPTDFDFAPEPGRPGVHEFYIDGHRVLADLWRLWEPGQDAPISCELFTPPTAMQSAPLISKVLRQVAAIAGEAGAEQIPVPCPVDIAADASVVDVIKREFAFAWMRKRLA